MFKRLCITCLFILCIQTFGYSQVIPKMISVKGDTFIIGDIRGDRDEKPMKVFVKSFCISETEITVGQWKEYCLSEKIVRRMPKLTSIQNDSFPITMVTWNEAMNYCEWLSKKTGLKYTLPTEEQWEFAAKAGTNTTKMYSGSNQLDQVAWYELNSKNLIHKVATRKPNKLGIYDLSGNVSEWCLNGYYEYGKKMEFNSEKALRGGSFETAENYCTVYKRAHIPASDFNEGRGFRIVVNQCQQND